MEFKKRHTRYHKSKLFTQLFIYLCDVNLSSLSLSKPTKVLCVTRLLRRARPSHFAAHCQLIRCRIFLRINHREVCTASVCAVLRSRRGVGSPPQQQSQVQRARVDWNRERDFLTTIMWAWKKEREKSALAQRVVWCFKNKKKLLFFFSCKHIDEMENHITISHWSSASTKRRDVFC